MSSPTQITTAEFRAYLQRHTKRTEKDVIPVFDDFLDDVERVFRLRVAAEENYKVNRHLAFNMRGELPVSWEKIGDILNPQSDLPEESLMSDVARKCVNECESLLRDMRKVLTREREKVPIGNVQQMDAQCLRWLVRQPGRTHIEKAGPQQCIQAIVRKENYNTLENRVLKDFMQRVQYLADLYLRRNNSFKGHDTVKNVARLKHISDAFLHLSIMEDVAVLHGFPMPNYVLRQDRRYSKVWKQYGRIIKWADVAVRLWERRNEVADTLIALKKALPENIDSRAMYESYIWVNEIDGRKDLLDKPYLRNELGQFEIVDKPSVLSTGTVVVDLVGAKQSSNVLVYGIHPNAKPYLQNFKRPNCEDLNEGKYFLLQDILDNQDTGRLHDYLEQLKARVGGEKWIILVPDDWDALWQEKVLQSMPMSRSNVFLLWRSVAVVLGASQHYQNKLNRVASVTVCDYQYGENYLRSKLELEWNDAHTRKIPRRCSYGRTPEYYERRSNAQQPLTEYSKLRGRLIQTDPVKSYGYLRGVEIGSLAILSGYFFGRARAHENTEDAVFLADKEACMAQEGALYFAELQARGETAYYDELEELSIVGQNVDEENVVVYSLVEADDKWPGGKIKEARVEDAISLMPATHETKFFLCMGRISDTTPLKVFNFQTEESYNEPKKLVLYSRMAPGQGLAVVTVTGLVKPIVLDYVNNMRDSNVTKAKLENQMERSFPPQAPNVVADDTMWQRVRKDVISYVTGDLFGNAVMGQSFATAFGTARNVFTVNTLPPGASQLLLLKRKNVFGNDPDSRFPCEYLNPGVFEDFFRQLARDYQNDPYNGDVVRVIAWTYQCDHKAFKQIKQDILRRLILAVNCRMDPSLRLSTQGYTLLSNLCNTREEWRLCLNCILTRLKMHENDVINNFVRMLYNLLQFNPVILEHVDEKVCQGLIEELYYWYEYNLKRNKPQIMVSLLRSMLYILRRRRFDGKQFLKAETEMRCKLQEILKTKLPEDFKQDQLRTVVLQYLDGNGTIDGLVAVSE